MWNPTTGHVSPQYHVVFHDDFMTVLYIVAGMVPPNWADLVKQSSEIATPKNIDLADSWVKGQSKMGAIDLINNPVAVVFDHRDTRGPGYTPVKTLNPVVNCEGDGSYGDCSALPGYGRVENPAKADSWLVL